MRFCAIVLLMLVPLAAFADTGDESLYSCKSQPASVEVTLKPEMELKDLLTWAVGFTCKKFVFAPGVVSLGKKVTLIAPGKQSPEQAYEMFTTALATMGLTVVPKGKLLQIVETASSKGHSLPLYNGKRPPDGEQLVRYVMRPQYAQPETMRTAFNAFKSEAGDVQVIGALLVVTDHGSNITDMISMAKLIDMPGGTDGIYTIPIHHADATKLATELGTLLGVSATTVTAAPTKGGAETIVPRDAAPVPSKLLVDERTNTLVVMASQPAFERVKALVERLDIALEIDGGTSIHVYQLGSAVAEELAKTLNDAIQAQATQQGDKKSAAPGAVADLGQLQGPARVISDKATNKLIIMSSGRDFLALREVIRELDEPRRQVYIEATILEVEADNGLKLGTASHYGYSVGSSGSLLVGGVQAPDLKSTDVSSLTGASGLIGGLIGSALPGSSALFGKSIPSYAVLFQALADTSHTNILSTMPIIVVDNEQAKYKVGTNVPYAKGVLPTTPTATSSLTTNIEREPLLLELSIKPHISTDDTVLLEVQQAAKDATDDKNSLGPTWTERSVDTRVVVRDQQTVVLGGLMQTRDTRSESKVPILGDIPILGHLFKYTSKGHKKTNLLILLTPYIIKDNLDLEAIRTRKQREFEEFAGSFRNLDGQPYLPRIDYGRKRGLVEEINRTIQDIESEAAARASLHSHIEVTPGLVEPHAEEPTP